jgi:hypothetical protein
VRNAADADNRRDPFRVLSGERIDDARAVGIADHRCAVYPSGIQHGDHVCYVLAETVCRHILRLVSLTMTSVVEK